MIFPLLACGCLAQTNTPITFTNGSEVISNAEPVRVERGMLIYRLEGGSGGTVKLRDLPPELQRRFGYDPAREAQDEANRRQRALEVGDQELNNAIASGLFREVDGVVYDLRKQQPGWAWFPNARLINELDGGEALIDPNPDEALSIEAIHVKHIAVLSDTERFGFRAKLVGRYTYINKAENQRVVRSYDAGRACKRNEIPEPVLKGLVAFQRIAPTPMPSVDVLPGIEADRLTATGTGFMITDDGYLVTNCHVVEDAKRLQVRFNGRTLDAKVVKISQAFDLAVLKVEGTFQGLPLDFGSHIGLGDSVFTIGFPNIQVQGAAPKYTDGKISSLAGPEDDPSQYQISVPIQPGNSGGALVAENGGVIGIVRAKLNDLTALVNSGSVPQNVNYAVKAKYLRDLLETIPGLLAKVKAPSPSATRAQVVKAVEHATVTVLVY